MLHWVLVVTGLSDASGHWYLLWSGFFGVLTSLSILGVAYRKLNCHVSGCHRIGLHHIAAGEYIVCRTHHPDHLGGKIKLEHIMVAHRKHKKQ